MQLALLVRTKTWYIDDAFKVVKHPFMQLASIHAFIRKDGQTKQDHLCFILMSGRKRRDYEAVLRTLMELLPQRPNVCQVVSDIEDALWKATSNVLAGVTHRGCSFHWAQAVWRLPHGLGLQTAYKQQEAVYRFCRKLLVLHFLPASSIVTVFEQMEAKAKTHSCSH